MLSSSRVTISASSPANQLTDFYSGIATPPMFDSITYGTYIFYGFWCGAASVWAYFLVPETMGKTLEQVDEAFGDFSGQEEQAVMREIVQADIVSKEPVDV